MAHRRAIGVVSRTLASLLYERLPRDELGTLPVEIYQAKDFETPIKLGLSVFLWRVTPNITQRALPPTRLPDGRNLRPSLPVDLHYCITAWAETAETQQRILGCAMRVLEDLGPVPACLLNHFVAEDDTFAEHEALDFVLDPMPLGDYLAFWDRLKALPLSTHYIVRLLLLDSDVDYGEFPAVAQREFRMADAP